jgi:ABC-type transporter Mla subunit MlaD
MTGLQPLHAALQSQLDDAAAHIGQQRQTINALREALKDALAYVEHWQADVRCNLKPTVETLATAHAEISAAIKSAA